MIDKDGGGQCLKNCGGHTALGKTLLVREVFEVEKISQTSTDFEIY